MKRVIAVLDLPPSHAPQRVQRSYTAAAKRWGCELLWIRETLFAGAHPWWQKPLVAQHIRERYGPAHVLQLDNDMLIRNDCPNIFDLAEPSQMAWVAERQAAFRSFREDGWHSSGHQYWGEMMDTEAAPAWFHANGGLYMYGTEDFADMLTDIFYHFEACKGETKLAADEAWIANAVWHHRKPYRFLPPVFNLNLRQFEGWDKNPVMQAYVYHFVQSQKGNIKNIRWRRSTPPALPHPNAVESVQLVEKWGMDPPDEYDMGPVDAPENILNLFSAYPSIRLRAHWLNPQRNEQLTVNKRSEEMTTCGTGYALLSHLLHRIGPHAERLTLTTDENND